MLLTDIRIASRNINYYLESMTWYFKKNCQKSPHRIGVIYSIGNIQEKVSVNSKKKSI